MLAPDSVLNEHYRITYLVEERPDCRLYRAIDQRDSLRVLIAELPQPSEAAVRDVQQLAEQIVTVSAPGLLTLRDHFAQELNVFLVAEDAGGQDLERVARDRGGPLPEDEVLSIVQRLLVTLDALHEHHPALYLGDLRSSDLWSSPDGGLFLAPFALARHIGTEPSPYRAPELNDASAEPTTTSDIYALGAVLYQLLTGWAPPTPQQREGGTPLNSPRVLNARVSALAEQLSLRALELKPANRYQRAREMRSALETVRLMAGRPLGATAPAPALNEELRTVGPMAGAPPPTLPAPPNPVPAAPASPEVGVYGPPPAPPPSYPQGYPPAQPQYAGYAAPAGAAQARSPFLSTGCLVAIIVALALVALVLCIIGAYVLSLYLNILPGAGLPGAAGMAAATAPAAAPAAAPTPSGPLAIDASATYTQTRQIREDSLGAALYAPEGELLAVGLGNNIQLRRGEDLEPGPILSGHTGGISALAFSGNGAILASGAQDDNSIRLWDVAAARQVRELTGHEGWIRSLAFSPDNRLLASSSTDLTVRLWDVQSGQQLAVFEGHTDWLGSIAFSPDGATLASASRDGTVRLWDVQSRSSRGDPIFTAPENPAGGAPFWLTGLAYSPDGSRLATGSISGSVYVLDAQTGRLQRELTGHEGWVTIRGVSFSPDGRTLASASLDGSVRIWLPGSGVELAELRQGNLRLLGLSWHPDSSRLAVSSDTSGRLHVWDVQSQRVLRTLQLTQGAVTALSYAGSGTVLATGGAGGLVRLHALDREGASTDLPGGAPTSQYIGFLRDTQLVAVSEAGEVVVVDLSQQSENRHLEGLDGFALNLLVSPDRRLIAAGNERGQVTIWDAETFKELRTLSGLGGPVYALAFSRDGALLAAATNQPIDRPEILLWDVASGERRVSLEGHAGPITALGLPAGEDVLVSSSSDGSLKVWDRNSGAELRSISVPPADGWFSSFTYSPDGSLLVTGTFTGAVQFWDPRSGALLNRLDLGGGTVLGLSFRTDGDQIAVSTRDGGVFLLEPAG